MQADAQSLPRRQPAHPVTPRNIVDAIVNLLDARKAEEIVTIPLAGKSAIADYMVIASGSSHRQVTALAELAVKELHELGVGQISVEGLPRADWVLIDAGDVIVHIFRPEVRAFYNLEKLWMAPALADGGRSTH
ncbi:MAG: ribosomal silencing factor RsfS [Rhodothalassiaceae bacterium]|nr:MAG: ribosomal silencing factor RsfS [Rhodothalassiaceae bacterium]